MKTEYDRKAISKYKLVLGKMLIAASKYGINKERTTTVHISHYVVDSNIYPIVLINQKENPWGMRYTPAKLYMQPLDLPDNIDVFSEELPNDVVLTKSYEVNLTEFKKTLKELKELTLDGTELSLPLTLGASTTDGYPRDLLNIASINRLIDAPTTKSDKYSVVVDDVDKITKLRDKLTADTVTTVDTPGGTSIKLFYMNAPIVPEKITLLKYTVIHDTEIITTVQCILDTPVIRITSYYKYLDIWSIEGEGYDK